MILEKWDSLRRPPKSSLEFEQREHKNEENSIFRCRSGSNVFYFKSWSKQVKAGEMWVWKWKDIYNLDLRTMVWCLEQTLEILARTRAGMKKIKEWKNRANSIFRGPSHRSDQGFIVSISIRGPERLIFQWGSFKGNYFQKESSCRALFYFLSLRFCISMDMHISVQHHFTLFLPFPLPPFPLSSPSLFSFYISF